MNTTASPKTPLPVPSTDPDDLEERARRARAEAMSVLALGDGLYEVESESGHTYMVDLEAGRCTCPDHVFRDARCKHIRRVAIEITEARTPPPGQIAVECTDCARTVFVDETESEPHYCHRHAIANGDAVRDKETGDRLTVVDVSDRRADAVRIPEAGCTVDEYGTNERYDGDVPVVGVVYPHARIGRNGPVPDSLKVYVFPRTRLEKVTKRRDRPPRSRRRPPALS
ncbi:SWIM zinc finger family protein [Natrialbaceae archaeon GCM10025810]|uniref:SWIM zinc finger family protein n=1 Tax=Halovalidus salilacus TaxID=3075124 RepID=UPI00360BC575